VKSRSSAHYTAELAGLGPHRVVGGGSNLLLSDNGRKGTLVVLSSQDHGVLEIEGSRDSRFKSSDRGQLVILEAVLALADGGLHVPAYAELAKRTGWR